MDARRCCVGADDIGANQIRKRLWILAYPQGLRVEGQPLPTQGEVSMADAQWKGWWSTEPRLDRMADGMAHRMDRLEAIGNGWVPQCAALAWRILTA